MTVFYIPSLSKVKTKYEMRSFNTTAAGFRLSTLKTAYKNRKTIAGMGVRGRKVETGGGRGSLMLRSMMRPYAFEGLKAGIMIVKCFGAAKYATDSLKNSVGATTTNKYRTSGLENQGSNWNKSKTHLEIQAKSCVASPESERTAFSFYKSFGNFTSLQKQLALSAFRKTPRK
ncbi:unnamed protein product [Orchesella dallaii]|uniref:Uncharacterized protein n=1 Tax=Orchesella dallaii TaxID=48710 RepID=A0ABP1R3H2_9HEXA